MISLQKDSVTRKGSLLDLLFVNKEGFVGDVIVEGCLGHSDNKEIEFQMFGVIRKKGPPLPAGWRAHFIL